MSKTLIFIYFSDIPSDLQPCHVCGRTFVSASLKKHEKVCEKQTVKKRKPFDSLKQRVEGTDIAPFHQKSYLKKPEPTIQEIKKPKRNTWKEKHIELLNSIRAAKGKHCIQFQQYFLKRL